LRAVLLVAPVLVALAASCNGMREDELQCEQAVMRLRECCPGFVPTAVNCYYDESQDCSGNTTGHSYPAIRLEDSKCIEQTSCADLRRLDLCRKGQNALRRVDSVADGGPTPYEPPRICD
jgi:hypothetical protein